MKTPALPSAAIGRWGTTTLLLVALAVGLAACYPGTVDNITELDLVVTNYDTEFKFDSIRFYAMSDSVIDIGKTSQEGRLVFWDASNLSSALSTIESQMTARGYQRVDLPADCTDISCLPANVEFFMMVGAVTSKTTVVGGGWGCYPYWGYGGCWGYPGCCSYAYSYESGTLVTNLLKPDGDIQDPDVLTQVHWNAAVQGVLSSNNQSNQSRIQGGLAQAFAQSPYLQAAPPAPAMTMVKGDAR